MESQLHPRQPGRSQSASSVLARLWTNSPPLTAASLLMVAALGACLIGLFVDPRTITGAPAWLKPAKFAASTGIYMLTLAWIFGYLPAWRRTRGIVGWVTAGVMILEVAIISLQAWRGVTSHFNVATPGDGMLFSTMGLAIVSQTLTSIAVAVALWRQTFTDRVLGWALRLGMVITIIGASTGGLMARPTAAQMEEVRATGRVAVMGSHTVGGLDGGAGLPGTGWSVEHGDLRVPHFLGLHALQALSLVALVLGRRRWPETVRVRLMIASAASYAAFFAILLWQALRGQPLVSPDAGILAVLAIWAIATVVAAWLATTYRVRIPGHAVVLS